MLMTLPSHDTVVRRVIVYAGHVQGVGFRWCVQNIAMQYDVAGYVRNIPEQQVEVVLEGRSEDINQIARTIQTKMGSFIRETRSSEAPPTHKFDDFSIQY